MNLKQRGVFASSPTFSLCPLLSPCGPHRLGWSSAVLGGMGVPVLLCCKGFGEDRGQGKRIDAMGPYIRTGAWAVHFPLAREAFYFH